MPDLAAYAGVAFLVRCSSWVKGVAAVLAVEAPRGLSKVISLQPPRKAVPSPAFPPKVGNTPIVEILAFSYDRM